MNAFLSELKQRKVVPWAIGYLAGAWVLLQVLAFLAGQFDWPATITRSATIVLGIGFLGALVLAWYHGERGPQRPARIELALLGVVALLAGAGALAFGRADAAAPRLAESQAEAGSVAVLPFVNMSGNADNEYFSDGITEEILNALVKVPGLRVAARTSSFAFKGRNEDVSAIGRKLRVAHVLEGSVQRAGERARITAQLIEVATGFHVWSDSYDRELKDVFAVEDEISKKIAEQLQAKIAPGVTLASTATDNAAAHDLYLRGRYLWGRRTESALLQAVDFFRQAIALDPTYADAQVGLADALISAGVFRWLTPEQTFVPAKAAAQRALLLRPGLGGAHRALANALKWYDYDWVNAEREFKLALAQSPKDGSTHYYYGQMLDYLGRHQEAERHLFEAARLEPATMQSLIGIGQHYVVTRQYDLAEAQLKHAMAVDSTYANSYRTLGSVYLMQRKYAEAQSAYARGAALFGNRTALDSAQVQALRGNRSEAKRLLRIGLEVGDKGMSILRVPEIYIALGEVDTALSLLERALATREIMLSAYGLNSPLLDSVRSHPRFIAIQRKIGL